MFVGIHNERLLYRRNMQYESISAISWHPTRPFHFIVVYTRGTVFGVSFAANGVSRLFLVLVLYNVDV